MKSPPPPPARPRTALVAVLGSTPAVLTEALWALARESPAVIPDIVVVVTTTAGRRILHEQLLSPRAAWKAATVWQALRFSLLGKTAPADPRLSLATPVVVAAPDPASGLAHELDDIRTPADNAAAAETILATVRQFTTDSDTRLLGLLAGGRKTMGALLHAALSLAGRPGDRLLHVLVNEPFDHPALSPVFYFPGQPGPRRHRPPGAPPVENARARLELADVPLVALGELVLAQTGRAPATFAALTRTAGDTLASLRAQHQPLTLAYDPARRRLRLNATAVTLPRGRCAALAEFLWQRARVDADHLRNADLFAALEAACCRFDYNGAPRDFSAEDVNRALNELRDAVARAGGEPLRDRLLPRRCPVGFNREGVTVA